MTIGAYPSDSLAGGNGVAAPAAATSFGTAAAADAGLYEITATVILWGTAETTLNNVRLRTFDPATAAFTTIATGLPASTGVPYSFALRRSLKANMSVILDVGSNAAAGANYGGVVTLRRIG